MRRIEISVIYDAETGKWLNVGAVTYDKNNNIVEVEHWNGNEFVVYEKGEFIVDHEDGTTLLYDKKYELSNLKQGLSNLLERCNKLKELNKDQLIDIYGNISLLIEKSMTDYSTQIAYPAQSLQSCISGEIKKRIVQ